MYLRKNTYIFLLWTVTALLCCGNASAISVAVFPIDDLSKQQKWANILNVKSPKKELKY